MTSFRGQASWAEMMSPVGKLTALACCPAKKVHKAEELTYLSSNIGNSHQLMKILSVKVQKLMYKICFSSCKKLQFIVSLVNL
jgi:hypothetical protein